jgi:hypothetical protein
MNTTLQHLPAPELSPASEGAPVVSKNFKSIEDMIKEGRELVADNRKDHNTVKHWNKYAKYCGR